MTETNEDIQIISYLSSFEPKKITFNAAKSKEVIRFIFYIDLSGIEAYSHFYLRIILN